MAQNKWDTKTLQSVSFARSSVCGMRSSATTMSRTQAPRRSKLICEAGAGIEYMNSEELEVALQETRDIPLVIDFFATWCGPCVLLTQELEKVAEELGDEVRIIKIDTDQNPEVSSQLQIAGLPTIVFVGTDRTKPALRTEGLLPAAQIVQIVKEQL